MKLIIASLLMIGPVSHTLLAQHDFQKGYIITLKQDTIHGFIDNKNNRQLSRNCLFKLSQEAKPQKYAPGELKGFRFSDGKYFVSREIEDEGENKLLFVEYLVDGVVDLYYYRSSEGDRYLIEKDNQLYFLEETVRDIKRDGVRYRQKDKTYIGTLNFIMHDAPEVQKKLNEVQLDHNPLIKLTSAYHYAVCETGEACIVYQRKQLSTKITLGPMVGINLNTIDVIDNDFSESYFYFINSEFTQSINISFGIFINSQMPKISDRLSLQLEALINMREFQTTNELYDEVYYATYTNHITINQTSANTAFFFRFELPSKQIKPSFLIGGFLDYNFTPSFTRRQEIWYNWNENREDKNYKENSLDRLDWGVSGGIGVSFPISNSTAMQISLRYSRGFGILFPHFNSSGFSLNAGIPLFSGGTD